MKNLSIENITKACRGTFHGDESILSQEVSGVVIDSRKVQPGYLFVAIDGERVNAHKFIPDTVKAGAMCVVSHEDLGETDFPYILVESTGQALLDIAKLICLVNNSNLDIISYQRFYFLFSEGSLCLTFI